MDIPKTRYALAVAVEIEVSSMHLSFPGELQNISLSGCYVCTTRSVPQHTRVRIALQTGTVKANVWGTVCRQDENGLGIQFTNGSTVEDWKALETVIHQLASSIFPKSQATSAGL